MYRIKPGRGPSLIGAIAALVIGVPFVLFWIAGASKSGAPAFLPLFGVLFLVLLLFKIAVGFYNASARDRISTHEITTDAEEGDPFQSATSKSESLPKSPATVVRFCPFCGTEFKGDSKFCVSCGKERPSVLT